MRSRSTLMHGRMRCVKTTRRQTQMPRPNSSSTVAKYRTISSRNNRRTATSMLPSRKHRTSRRQFGARWAVAGCGATGACGASDACNARICRQWREQRSARLAEKDRNEQQAINEAKAKASKELDEWYARYQEQLKKARSGNRCAPRMRMRAGRLASCLGGPLMLPRRAARRRAHSSRPATHRRRRTSGNALHPIATSIPRRLTAAAMFRACAACLCS